LSEDIARLTDLRSDATVRRFLGGALPDDEARRRAEQLVGSPDHVVAETASEFVGLLSVTRRHGWGWEISYEVTATMRGQGLAREAVGAVVAHVQRVASGENVVAVTQTDNVRSVRLLAALGFVERDRFDEFGAEQVLLALPASTRSG
jgi:[ribosomal protein S5]-alanine N-acetyltransferase